MIKKYLICLCVFILCMQIVPVHAEDLKLTPNAASSLLMEASSRQVLYANNEKEGNLYFLEQEGGTHNGDYAMEYFYNGLCWIWQ